MKRRDKEISEKKIFFIPPKNKIPVKNDLLDIIRVYREIF